MSGPTEAIAREMYEQLMNKGNPVVLDKYVDPGFVYQNPIKPVKGRQQIIDLVQAQRDAFRNFHSAVDHVVVGESSLAVAWTVTGIHEKDFFGCHHPVVRLSSAVLPFTGSKMAEASKRGPIRICTNH